MSSRSLRKLQEQRDEPQEAEESGEEVRARGKSNFNAFLLVRADLARSGSDYQRFISS